MRLIDADQIDYDILLKTGNKANPLAWAVSKNHIDDMPTIAGVAPIKHGKWILGKEISRSYLGSCCIAIDYEDIKCSSCKTIFQPYVGHFNYCPNCGAKMEEDDAEIH